MTKHCDHGNVQESVYLVYSSRERRVHDSGEGTEVSNVVAGAGHGELTPAASRTHRKKAGNRMSYVNSVPTRGDVLPPAKLHLPDLPKHRHQLGTKCLNTCAYGGQTSSHLQQSLVSVSCRTPQGVTLCWFRFLCPEKQKAHPLQ